MGSENEPAKLLLPYLQRADELQKHELLVAYYCRLYAMERGLKIPSKERTKTTNAILVSLINQLEKDKKSLKLGPEDNLYLEGFALNVFSKADKQDRAGRADLNTAKTFYAASIFFEILNQFGELAPDLEQKQKYAAWKAADIRKALKEGRRPEPGPPGGEKDLSVPSDPSTTSYDLGTQEISPVNQDLGQSQSFSGNQPSVDLPSRPDIGSTGSFSVGQARADISSRPEDNYLYQQPSNASLSPSPSKSDYPSHDFQPAPAPSPPPSDISDHPSYSQPYNLHHQSYTQDNAYQSHDDSSFYNYSNFQSYPSFSESSLPSVPAHYPSQYQGTDIGYSPQAGSAYLHQSGPVAPNYSVPGGQAPSTTVPSFNNDVNYKPTPEKIAEAHKAAKLAVGALAFDDVAVAVDYLKQSLELLTNSSARR
ncbi:protein HOMOLOG OF MAMMALIAN LYST-INTERACTING PROTEIN 5 [Aristolochia californica]|uniref:protein HOMOLOG OF MAMMALIAN LYST-INTERACTING PROTEIN 5 n=1 Tax=Aristolochia californica TaxID=171875 RepID=UPI0035D5FC06